MIRWLISVAIHLGANAIALWLADLILDDLHIEWSAFIMAVAIFTLVEVLAEPLLTKIALSSMPALRGSVALIATFVGLLVTDLVSDGLNIERRHHVDPGHDHRLARRPARRHHPADDLPQEGRRRRAGPPQRRRRHDVQALSSAATAR